jgi:glutamate synthase domain-containing protein 1
MCGIVGLFLKNPSLQPDLGLHLAAMLGVMSDRGPDSAGFAIYGSHQADHVKLTLRAASAVAIRQAVADLGKASAADLDSVFHDTHAVVSVPLAREPEIRQLIAKDSGLTLVGVGARMELFKEVGLPEQVTERFELSRMSGTHGIGHTRMATESAVTTHGAHPFSTGKDQCLVHNGSLSNHCGVRRFLSREGLSFETDNDSEVAAGFLTWRMHQGASLEQALTDSLTSLDGFYTFVVGTESGFAVLRDPISCKPAVMAETDDYVAFGSEYRALAVLPDVGKARVFEPEPAKVYAWELS